MRGSGTAPFPRRPPRSAARSRRRCSSPPPASATSASRSSSRGTGRCAAPSPSELVRTGHGPVEILGMLLAEHPARVLEERDVRFECRCSPAKVRGAIIAMGTGEIAALLDEGKPAEATCEFCNTAYAVEEPELRALLDSLVEPGHGSD